LLDSNNDVLKELEITTKNFENTGRATVLLKVPVAYQLFKELVSYYAVQQINDFVDREKIQSTESLRTKLPSRIQLSSWKNIGGQLIQQSSVEKLITHITANKIKSWDEIHAFYKTQADNYSNDKLAHALAALKQVYGTNMKKITDTGLKLLFQQSITVREWMVKGIYDSRAKDYTNPFRQMTYESTIEMQAVTGKLEDNSFIKKEIADLKAYKIATNSRLKKLNLS